MRIRIKAPYIGNSTAGAIQVEENPKSSLMTIGILWN